MTMHREQPVDVARRDGAPRAHTRSTLAERVSSPYVAVRLRTAEHPATTVEGLAILAEDSDPSVRRAAERRLGRSGDTRRRAG